MKKIFVAIMAAFALALAGCGSSNGESQPTEEPQSVIGQDCPSGMEQWQCDQFSQMAENAQNEQEQATEVTIPTPTEEPIDPDKVYKGSLDESQGITKISVASIMDYDDGVSITLEQMEAFAHEAVGCTESNDPCYVVLRINVDNYDSSDDYDPATDPRSEPVIEYVNTSEETVTVEPSKQALEASSYGEDNDGDSFGVVKAGEGGQWYYGYRLDDFKNVEGESYKTYFEDDESGVVWVEEDIDF
ncbi:MAG: hypothetical protein L0H38_02795 [bacterium]|nr:hypothetical protein [bacterium]